MIQLSAPPPRPPPQISVQVIFWKFNKSPALFKIEKLLSSYFLLTVSKIF